MKKYKAKIVKRTTDKFCVYVPRELINTKQFRLGQLVEVTLKA